LVQEQQKLLSPPRGVLSTELDLSVDCAVTILGSFQGLIGQSPEQSDLNGLDATKSRESEWGPTWMILLL